MTEAQIQRKKVLIFRLSSLGDVVLSTSALQSDLLKSAEVHWVVRKDFEVLLQGNPQIDRLWCFERSNLKSWIRLCSLLWKQEFDEVFDLHSSLRTQIARVLFRVFAVFQKKPMPKWTRVKKAPFRLFLFFLLKKIFPKRLRPDSWIKRFALTLGGDGSERPDLSYLCKKPDNFDVPLYGKKLLCLMPGSKWAGKQWSVQNYFRLVYKLSKNQNLSFIPVVLGSKEDAQSKELVQLLEKTNVEHYSGVDKWDLSEVAYVLSQSLGYFGNDTGLGHLAEAVGARSWVIFGPTSSECGFGPWREQSRAIEKKIWCRPCGRYGKRCHRVFKPYECLKGLTPEFVIGELQNDLKFE